MNKVLCLALALSLGYIAPALAQTESQETESQIVEKDFHAPPLGLYGDLYGKELDGLHAPHSPLIVHCYSMADASATDRAVLTVKPLTAENFNFPYAPIYGNRNAMRVVHEELQIDRDSRRDTVHHLSLTQSHYKRLGCGRVLQQAGVPIPNYTK